MNNVTYNIKYITIYPLTNLNLQKNQSFKLMKKLSILNIEKGLGLAIFSVYTFHNKYKISYLGKIEISKEKPHRLNWAHLIEMALTALVVIFLWQSYKKNPSY